MKVECEPGATKFAPKNYFIYFYLASEDTYYRIDTITGIRTTTNININALIDEQVDYISELLLLYNQVIEGIISFF